MEKGTLERLEPGFRCRVIVGREQVQKKQSQALVDKLFDGSASMLVASLLESRKLDDGEVDKLKALIERYEKGGG